MTTEQIYCYLSDNILGFMSSTNHSIDNEVFYTINVKNKFSETMNTVNKLIDAHVSLLDQDNLHWTYSIPPSLINTVKNILTSNF